MQSASPVASTESSAAHANTCSSLPTQGCPCAEGSAAQSCFLPDTRTADNRVMCSEGTRECRNGVWTGCENTHSYIVTPSPATQDIIDPNASSPTCSICDVLCFKVIDNLIPDAGAPGVDLTYGSAGGLTLAPNAAAADAGDAGGSMLTGCAGLNVCCSTLSGALQSACVTAFASGVDATCNIELAVDCPTGAITGPVTGCSLGSGPDSDCDGIPNAVDDHAGPPFSDTDNQTIFHELAVGQSANSALDLAFKLQNADVYILFDTTGTMEPERQTLQNLLSTGDVVSCAQLNQCCGTNTTCTGIVNANNETSCANAQPTYCGKKLDCADTDSDGAPNNELKTEGVVGGIRCLIGTAWFGLGQFREVPVHSEPEQDPCLAEGCRYGDRDEQLFTHLIDMTPDSDSVRAALSGITMNYNWDEPEGGFLALNSVVTGRGHYFGMNRPAVPDRSAGQGCAPSSFGYPCFRNDAVPIVVMFTDAPHHNGPGTAASDPSNCNGRGAGCPYSAMSSLNVWNSGVNDSASDRVAHYVTQQAERATSAYEAGDLRGQYLTLVGDTTHMQADYPSSAVGCGAADDSPDALVHFTVSPGAAIDVNFHMTKNDAYASTLYGRWVPWSLTPGTDDPTPATEFGSVVSVFKGTPDDLGGSGTRLHCAADAQPNMLRGSSWDRQAVDFSLHLSSGEYFVSVKGVRAVDRGGYQLQLGQTSARAMTTYRAPTWSETRAALVSSGVRVIPVVATGGTTSAFSAAAEAQAKLVAQVSGAVRSDGTPIWHKIQNDGVETGSAIVMGVAELAQHLAMNVSLNPVDGPDPGASLFQIAITPQNSLGCLQPHPLLDADDACTGTNPFFSCNTQYNCRPGATPAYRVTFTNPVGAPVPPNPANPYGGYLFKLQLMGNGKYLLGEVPVFLIPTNMMLPPPPVSYQTTGAYEQDTSAAQCRRQLGDAGTGLESSYLPSWNDLYFDADIPPGASIDFELCAADTAAGLSSCTWNADGTRPKVTVTSQGTCTDDSACTNVPGFGDGFCTKLGTCQFISLPKIYRDVSCSDDSKCPNGPLGAGDYMIHSRCETTHGAYGFGHCVATSEPVDIGSTLLVSEQGKLFTKVRITLHATPDGAATPVLADWYLTYDCRASL